MFEVGGDPIGGYFELELPERQSLPYPGAVEFQSARAAFRALIRAGNPERVWMPKYICNAMLAPLEAEDVECVWYDVNEQFEVEDLSTVRTGDWLLYVNYFGICNTRVTKLIERFPVGQLVFDFSQSFFAPPIVDALATIYSPRKFFGIPDGGILVSRNLVPFPKERDTGSLGRTSHLLRRLGDSPEAGYVDFQRAEMSLTNCEPKRISKLTERILRTINFSTASLKRTRNFLFLHNQIGEINRLTIDSTNLIAPMCYPLLTHDERLRRRLIENRIFVPTYWPDAVERLSDEQAEKMVNQLLPLPIDQRYGEQEMQRIVSVIQGRKS